MSKKREAPATVFRLLVLDIDGVLTDGTAGVTDPSKKKLFLRDIDALTFAQGTGLQVAFLTGEGEMAAKDVVDRCGGGPAVFGAKDKAAGIRRLAEMMTVNLNEICYVADADRDVPAMELVGFAFAPCDASPQARSAAGRVLRCRGGRGAVEETVGHLLRTSTIDRSEIEAGLKNDLGEIARLSTAFEGAANEELCDVIEIVVECLHRGGKVVIFGNGGSAAIAQHVAAELVGRFSRPRGPLPAVALTSDIAVITALANDFGFECVFERQVEAAAQFGDVVIGMSTSGESGNVARGLAAAKKLDATPVAFVGAEPGIVGAVAGLCVTFPSRDPARIQELHLMALHAMCRQVDTLVSHFPDRNLDTP